MNDQQPNQGHPAWKPILDSIPEAFHSTIRPQLEEWDKGVQQKLQSVRDEYKNLEAYKQFAKENVDPEFVEQAVIFANRFQQNPQAIMDHVNKQWNLGYANPSEVEQLKAQLQDDDDEDPYSMNSSSGGSKADLLKNPEFLAMQQTLNEMKSQIEGYNEAEEEERAIAEHNALLDDYEKEHGSINRMLVTAFMSQGLDLDDAVSEYHKALAGTVTPPEQEQAGQAEKQTPVVMGGNGQSGTGVPGDPVKFGEMKKADVTDAVLQFLQADQANSNQG